MENAESVTNKLQELIKQYDLEEILTIDMIKDLIWHEEGDKAFHDFIAEAFGYFKDIKDTNELNRVLQVFNDAWNYFPHKSLDGLCPMEKIIVNEVDNMGEVGLRSLDKGY